MALVVKCHMAAGLLDFFDVFTKHIRTTERRADFQVRILVVMAGMIPSEEADRIATMGLGEFVKLWQGIIWPHFVAELLFIDDKEVSCHVLNPFWACRLRTILRHPGGIVLCAFMPVAVIEVEHDFRNGHGFSCGEAYHPCIFENDSVLADFALLAELRREEIRIMACEEKRVHVIRQCLPLHGGAAARIDDGMCVEGVFTMARHASKPCSDVLDALSGLCRKKQCGSSIAKRNNRPDNWIGEIEDLRVRLIVDIRIEDELIIFQRGGKRQFDRQRFVMAAVECFDAVERELDGRFRGGGFAGLLGGAAVSQGSRGGAGRAHRSDHGWWRERGRRHGGGAVYAGARQGRGEHRLPDAAIPHA